MADEDSDLKEYREIEEKIRRKLRSFVEQMEGDISSLTVLVTKVSTDGATHSYEDGCGNWFARVHHAKQFVERDDVLLKLYEVDRHSQRTRKRKRRDGEE